MEDASEGRSEDARKTLGEPSEDRLGGPLDTITCRRHPDRPGPRLARPPFRSELGERIVHEICADCWRDWLQHQTLLINHFGLDPRKPESREFLYGQTRAVLFGEGEVAEIDTSKQGTIGKGGWK